ncbi:MAG: SDR family oxidoreductase [Bacteroidetes bacterium]|nr:SDR family oxidoreductase [Rhodothermia bacterium]MCS7154379.1 SDR family oxidoreductase [Bacteroidota bacterium]MCX7907624.1 SDR family oxidoreductase [Bacteroidota bacterium]MDW8137754.1 SDR family oxidoreductase [Bacteroidota bacterium]MDW8286396.1 SDR family oxidoreductase [Bacteroidota bacterium]
MRLEGKVALVTGGAVRIGRGIVQMLARAGCEVAFTYYRSEAEAHALAEALREETKRKIVAWPYDARDPEQAQTLLERIRSLWGRLDVLVLNAAVFFRTPWEELTETQWDTLLDINLKGPFFLAQAAARQMLRQEPDSAGIRGKIVAISDVAAELVWRAYLPYQISKAGLNLMVRVLAKNLAPSITVNAVAPSTILPEPGRVVKPEEFARDVPLGRPGTVEEVAAAVRFLLEHDFLTGHVLHVDGGRSLV